MEALAEQVSKMQRDAKTKDTDGAPAGPSIPQIRRPALRVKRCFLKDSTKQRSCWWFASVLHLALLLLEEHESIPVQKGPLHIEVHGGRPLQELDQD